MEKRLELNVAVAILMVLIERGCDGGRGGKTGWCGEVEAMVVEEMEGKVSVLMLGVVVAMVAERDNE